MIISTYKQIYLKLAVVAIVLYPLFVQLIALQMIFFNCAVNCFNSLPVNVIISPTISSFKNALCSIDLSDFIKCSYFEVIYWAGVRGNHPCPA